MKCSRWSIISSDRRRRMKRLEYLGWLWMVLIFWIGPLPIYGASPPRPHSMESYQEGKAIELKEVSGILEAYFQNIYPENSHHIEIRDIRGYERMVLPPGLVSYSVIVSERGHQGGNIPATILFLVNGQEIKRLRITARVDIYADVVAARHYLKKYQEIKEQDLQVVNRNISLLPHDVVTEVKEVLGKRTTLSVNGNEILRIGMIEVPPLIKKGDRVILLVENDHFKITAVGEVREDGRRGDRVKLVNLSSKKGVYGRVLDANTVEIDF
jgi:flagella basal body P-ring formation protein FlgA